MSMIGSKWDIKKFFKSNNFGLWKVNMQEILTQQKCVKALKDDATMPTILTRSEKTEMIDEIKSTIILCLKDKVLREVTNEKITMAMWTKLESLYMTNSLAR